MITPNLREWDFSEFDLIETLWRYGHFFSPEALAVAEVVENELPSLTLADAVVQAAVRSYQSYFLPQLEQFTMRPVAFGGHERPAIPDGDVGESTVLLLTSPRCGVPDFLPPNAASLQANWPESCRQQITTSYRMSLNGLTPEQLEAAWNASNATIESALAVKFSTDLSSYPNTRIFAFAANLGGSVLADQYLAQNRCDVRLQGRFAGNRSWDARTFETVATHEHLHGLGLPHVQDPDATMYPSIHSASLARRGALNETDVKTALSLGYSRAAQPVPPTPTDPAANRVAVLIDGKTYRGNLVLSSSVSDT